MLGGEWLSLFDLELAFFTRGAWCLMVVGLNPVGLMHGFQATLIKGPRDLKVP